MSIVTKILVGAVVAGGIVAYIIYKNGKVPTLSNVASTIGNAASSVENTVTGGATSSTGNTGTSTTTTPSIGATVLATYQFYSVPNSDIIYASKINNPSVTYALLDKATQSANGVNSSDVIMESNSANFFATHNVVQSLSNGTVIKS